MPTITKATRRDAQALKSRTYAPHHRKMSRAALVANRNAKRALLARYA